MKSTQSVQRQAQLNTATQAGKRILSDRHAVSFSLKAVPDIATLSHSGKAGLYA
jgi:hypothetical protein